jgi:hypothetical protein
MARPGSEQVILRTAPADNSRKAALQGGLLVFECGAGFFFRLSNTEGPAHLLFAIGGTMASITDDEHFMRKALEVATIY